MLSRLRRALPALTALDDDVRRRLYLHVRSAGRAVTRDEAAAATDISERLAAFHLDKLEREGLLVSSYARKPGRSGPGAGRTSKFYAVSDLEFDASIPERRYDFVGQILVSAIAAGDAGESPGTAARRIAADRGKTMGEEIRSEQKLRRAGRRRVLNAAAKALTELGYEPYETNGDAISLRSCPFHTLARQNPDMVCGINQAFIDGVLRGLGNDAITATLEPTPGQCCVKLRIT
jgi:predicted ArsR family transcriptional regulator